MGGMLWGVVGCVGEWEVMGCGGVRWWVGRTGCGVVVGW